ELARRLTARGFRVRLMTLATGERRRPRGGRREVLSGMGARDVLCVDGADLLGRLEWLRILVASRRAGGLVVTAHREGRLPTVYRAETAPALLAGIVATLDDSARPPTDLFSKNRGNVREALRELYDVSARASSPR
ncbi:MAG TPA: hypothetical protein VNC59_04185, partial [Thermoanaerobaculia bacterium]|nr:hypothetical protein [Thermoanaerobaculia bacterium]